MSAAAGNAILARRPDPRLRPDVLALYGYAEATPGPMRRRELPGSAVVMILELGPPIALLGHGGAIRHPLGFVAGLCLGPTLTETAGRQAGMQVMLSALGAGRLLGVPMGALGGGIVAVEEVLGPPGRDLALRLREAPFWEARFAILEAFLLARLAAARSLPAELAAAAVTLERQGGTVPIRALAAGLGCSERRLERRFRDELGLSPKRYARLLRFERAVQRIAAGLPLAEVAAETGFADQAHLTHEVRRFAGMTPAGIRRAQLPGEHGLAA